MGRENTTDTSEILAAALVRAATPRRKDPTQPTVVELHDLDEDD